MTRRFLSALAAPAALVLVATGCSVQYRHEVERPGTETHWRHDKGNFLRYDGYDRGEVGVAGDLEIAVTDYHREGSPTLRMVGVVHIADREYYHEIQKILDESDLVLYEGVNRTGEPGTVDPETRAMWSTISSLIGLRAQTSEIRYDRQHFKQCDLVTDPKFPKAGGGGGLVTPEMMGTLRQIAKYKNQARDIYPMEGMEDYLKHAQASALIQADGFDTKSMRDMIRQMRTLLEPFAMMDEQAAALVDRLRQLEQQMADMESLIIVERNQYVMGKIDEEIDALGEDGDGVLISVFYGAGHMSDFDARLAKIGYERGDSTWLKAWKMNSR